MSKKKNYTRRELISICERAVVNVENWDDRDTPEAHIGIGRVWVMLKAGCEFSITTEPKNNNDNCVTDDNTIWGYVYEPTFSTMEERYLHTDTDLMNAESFYLPTAKRLKEVNGKDWY